VDTSRNLVTAPGGHDSRELATPRVPVAAGDAPHPMEGQNVICFAKDWEEDPTSNNHIMRLLARGNRVLWLNSISTRTPSLRAKRDLAKIGRKLKSALRGPRQVEQGLWVYSPLVLPFPHNRLANALNTVILRIALTLIRWWIGMGRFQLWVFIPTAAKYVGKFGERLLVYYVTDEWSKFAYVDGSRVAADDRELCRKSDIVFASAQSLVRDRLPLNPETHLSRHGVDYELFSSALGDSTAIPADLKSIPGPVLGFYGTIQDWVNFDLLKFLAAAHPEWSIVLIGHPLVDLSPLQQFPNIHVLGRRPHSTLPAYCKGFSVGLIPYVLNERILHVNPIKLREYLSAGLPVVSVALPEVEAYADVCSVARSYAEFERAVADAIAGDSPAARRARSDAMRGETWERRVAEIGTQVMRVQQAKSAGAKTR
jgi:glycosyltransferase involved in cell wall biosynthesis